MTNHVATFLLLLLSFPHSRLADDWPDLETDLFVTANTYELIGFVGNAVTMYATVRGNPRPTADDITWVKMNDNMPEGRYVITFDTATNESRLRITELEYSDEGDYYCQASVNGISKTVKMGLRVVVEPKVERVSGLLNSKGVGQAATFSVSVSGNPIPTAENITWAKLNTQNIPVPLSDNRISYNTDKTQMIFSNLVIADEGWYKCLVITDEGRAEVEFVLYVLGMRSVEESSVGVVGNSVAMTCTATYFNMLSSYPAVTWARRDDPSTALSGASITRSTSDQAISTLTLTSLEWSDGGEYFCTAYYGSSYPEHSLGNTTLTIRGIAEDPAAPTAVLGNAAWFQCTVTGTVEPEFYWTRNDVTISESEHTSTFSEPRTSTSILVYPGPVVTGDSSAEFRCHANFSGQVDSSEAASITILSVTTPPSGVSAVIGSSTTLSCSSSSSSYTPSTFSWQRDGVPVFTSSIVNSGADSEVRVQSVAWADAGGYACTAFYDPIAPDFLGGNTTSTTGTLTVFGILTPPEQTIVKVGDTATFTCIAKAVTSMSVPTISWTKNGVSLVSGVQSPTTANELMTSSLVINDVSTSDVAAYVCTATYPVLGADVSAEADLRFRGIEVAPVGEDAVIGNSAQLDCTARGEAVAAMKWLANGTEVANGGSYSISTSSNYDEDADQDLIDTMTVLTVAEVTLDSTYTQWTCVAEWVSNSQVSSVESEPVSFFPLYVYSSPVNTIAVRYTTVAFSCSATKTPAIRWDRSGRTYGLGRTEWEGDERTHSTLKIGNVTESDEGKIWCVAEYGEVMADSQKATLTVVGITQEPEAAVLSERGQGVQFTCQVDRYPLNTLTWWKGDTQIYSYENRKNISTTTYDYNVEEVLTINSVTEEDVGSYYCKVTYPQGTQISQAATLTILEAPQITVIVATGGEKEGDSIELLCQATGVPKPDITWRRSGQPFPGEDTTSVVTIYNEPGSSLVLINSSSSEDQGVYSCVASNGVGDAVVVDTELIIESAVKVVTVASASSLLIFIIAVCTALMLFALYKRRKRKRLHPKEEDKVVVANAPEEDPESNALQYDNEASIFGDVKSCDDDDMEYESGIDVDDDVPTVEPPDENPALFLMPERSRKELPPISRGSNCGSGLSGLTPISRPMTSGGKLPSLSYSRTSDLPSLRADEIYQNEAALNGAGGGNAGIISDGDEPLGLNTLSPSPSLSGYNSGTDLGSSIGLPLADRMEPTRRVSLLSRSEGRPARDSPDPHYVPQSPR